MKRFRERRFLQLLCVLCGLVWLVAAIAPVSRSDWLLENALVFAALPLLIVGFRRRPLSDRAYLLIAIFFVLHQIGAHYTYSQVPLGHWLKDALHLERNHFDRVVHFAFGLLLTRPLAELLRARDLSPFWAALLPASVIASVSGGYEIVEAIVAWCVAPELGQAYLGTQGDLWDGQKDMALAILGAALAVARMHVERRSGRPAVLASLLLAHATGCDSTVYRRDWSNYTGPGARYFQQEEIPFPGVEDPIEPVNRVTSIVNYGMMRWIFAPIAFVYRGVVPEVARRRVTKLGINFQYPGRLLNNLLQAKWSAAGEETSRFLINTTIGLLGLFDPATDMGLEPHDEDFGQTMATWGWKNSTYLYLPVFGPSSIRDGVGLVPDTYTDLVIIDWRLSVGREVNRRSDEIDDDLRLIDSMYDAYEPARTLYTLSREVDVVDFGWKRDESGPTQSLDTIFLKPEDVDFGDRALEREVALDGERELPYTLWLQPDRAPLVYLVPGFGGHRLGPSSLGLAEAFYESGSSVIAVSNPTNWEFVEHGSSVDLPGYAPIDALDLHRALTAIDRQVEQRWPGEFTSRRLAGISLGAFLGLFIAANEPKAKGEGLVPFDVYVAMNPPVNVEHAMLQLDRCYNAPLKFPADERQRRIDEIFGKVIRLAEGDLQPGTPLPFTKLESEFLIGLAFRMDLQSLILQSQDRHDMGVLLTPRSYLRRAPAFREASEYSFLEYMHAFVLPYYARHDPRITFDEEGASRMFADCDLRSLADGLQANDRVRVFTNENDFLLRPEDLEWLRAQMGDRVHVFPAGGHLGNLHRKEIKQVIESIVEATDGNGAPDR